MSSTDSDQEVTDEYDELVNIKNVIILLRDNIDALNEKFADFPASELPAMYLEEYQELTTKLHELELKEQLLSEKLQPKNDTPDQTDQTDQTTEVSSCEKKMAG